MWGWDGLSWEGIKRKQMLYRPNREARERGSTDWPTGSRSDERKPRRSHNGEMIGYAGVLNSLTRGEGP